ncbi:MAG TPA: GNAT family N-acetyltransferase [Ktedonobacteraceae bacterium]|nr:GNAT family N-acetyltransferase [Ktedonobacteraceae bacterium]
MNQQDPRGKIKTEVTASDRTKIAKLIEDCGRYEGEYFPAPVEVLPAPSENKTAQMLHYEGDILTGFVYLQHGPQIEIYGVVHPDHRRKGVGTTLIEAAKSIQRQEGANGLLLVCNSALPCGKAFAEATRGVYRFSEHRMVLDPDSIERPQLLQGQQVQLRRAAVADVPILTHLVSHAFDDPEEETANWIAEDILTDNQCFYIGWLEGQPIGTLRTVSFGEQIDIATFGVLPPYRRRGYGRQILLAIVDLLLEEHWPTISLEVETKNDNALGLYKSCGFRAISTFDYYQVI